MATIPVLRGPRTQVQPSAGIGDISATQDIRGTAGAFGEAAAAGTAQLAQGLGAAADDAQRTALALQEADNRIKRREDSLRRVQTLAATDAQASEMFTTADSGGNLADPNQVVTLRDQMNQAFTKAEEDYQGSNLEEDRLIFLTEMAKVRSKWNGAVTERGILAGRNAMDVEMSKKVNEFAGMVTATPGALADAQVALQEWITQNYAPAMTPEEEATATQAGMETIATAAVDVLFVGGNYTEALARMEDPSIQPFLSPTRARELRLKAYAGQAETTRVQSIANAKMQVLRDAGIKITPRIAVAAATGINLSTARGPLTLAEKQAQAEGLLERPLTEEENQKLAGVHVGEDNAFGGGEKGRSRGLLADLNEEMRTGTIDPQDLTLYMGAVAAIRSIDPVTGTRGELDLATREALEAQGIDPDKVTAPGGVSQFTELREKLTSEGSVAAEQVQADVPPEAQEQVTEASQAIATATQGISEAAQATSTTPGGAADPVVALRGIAERNVRLFNVAHLIQGPVPALGRGLSRIPVVGEFIHAPQMNQLKQQLDYFHGLAVDAMRRTERATEQERNDIINRQLVNMKTAIISTPSVFRNSLIGLHDIMEDEARDISETLDKEGEVSGTRRRALQDRLDALRTVQNVMAVPPMVITEEEFFEVVQRRGLAPTDLVRARGKVVTVQAVQNALTSQRQPEPQSESEPEE